jgi:hypothetical protein
MDDMLDNLFKRLRDLPPHHRRVALGLCEEVIVSAENEAGSKPPLIGCQCALCEMLNEKAGEAAPAAAVKH